MTSLITGNYRNKRFVGVPIRLNHPISDVPNYTSTIMVAALLNFGWHFNGCGHSGALKKNKKTILASARWHVVTVSYGLKVTQKKYSVCVYPEPVKEKKKNYISKATNYNINCWLCFTFCESFYWPAKCLNIYLHTYRDTYVHQNPKELAASCWDPLSIFILERSTSSYTASNSKKR